MRGVAVGHPYRGVSVHLVPCHVADDGLIEPCFLEIMVPAWAVPGLQPFVSQALTPGLVRVVAWLRHENWAIALRVLIAVAGKQRAICRYEENLFGRAGGHQTDEGLAGTQSGDRRTTFLGERRC